MKCIDQKCIYDGKQPSTSRQVTSLHIALDKQKHCRPTFGGATCDVKIIIMRLDFSFNQFVEEKKNKLLNT
jgi:hypothetical protein